MSSYVSFKKFRNTIVLEIVLKPKTSQISHTHRFSLYIVTSPPGYPGKWGKNNSKEVFCIQTSFKYLCLIFHTHLLIPPYNIMRYIDPPASLMSSPTLPICGFWLTAGEKWKGTFRAEMSRQAAGVESPGPKDFPPPPPPPLIETKGAWAGDGEMLIRNLHCLWGPHMSMLKVK